MKIAIIAAMDKEATLLKQFAGDDVVIATSGIGKVAAALKTAEIIHNHHPDLIINSGVAGGLQSSLEIGDVVCGKTIAYHDVWCGNPNLYGQVQGFPPFYASDARFVPFLNQDIKNGLIVSGDKFISSPEDQADILKHFPNALAVDMESAAVAQTCYIYQTPCLVLRLISDTPGVEHHQKQYDRFWETAAEKSFTNLKEFLTKVLDANSSDD